MAESSASEAAAFAAIASTEATTGSHAALHLEVTNLPAHVAHFVGVGAVTLGVRT